MTAPTTAPLPPPGRDPAAMLRQTLRAWGGTQDLWLFGYASLIWKPEFDFAEQRDATVRGWHRALKMWSRVNRGTPEVPGLVFGLLSGGSCKGVVFRIERVRVEDTLARLWQREMVTGVYDPRWLPCHTPAGPVRALAFTLSRRSPHHTGVLDEAHYRRIFAVAAGHCGTTRDYAERTYAQLRAMGIEDRALARLLRLSQAEMAPPDGHS